MNDRQDELNTLTKILAGEAGRVGTRARASKVVVIGAGALIATREAFEGLVGANNTVVALLFALVGLVVATVSGWETAFKWEGRSAELRLLATSAQATVRRVDSMWQTGVGSVDVEAEKVVALRNIIGFQDGELAAIQERAAGLGVEVTRQITSIHDLREIYPA